MNTPASTKVEQLLPCPFCGGEPKQYPIRGIMGFTISCQSCGASAYESDPQRVALHWNQRATLTATPSGEGREAIARIIAPRSFDNEGSTSWHSREVGRRGAYAKADAILALLAPHKDTSHDD